MLEIEIKPEDHGAIIICEAINDELTESVHNAKTLSVKCKSVWRFIAQRFMLRYRNLSDLAFSKKRGDGGFCKLNCFGARIQILCRFFKPLKTI